MACFDFLQKFTGGQLGLDMPKKVSYFALSTPVGLPSMCLLEMSGKPYEGHGVKFEEWTDLKPKTPSGQLPYAEMKDGSFICESGAIGRVCAGAAGLLGSGKEFAISEMLVGMTSDMNKAVFEVAPTIMTVKDFTDQKQKAFMEKKPTILERFKKYERLLLPSGDRFTASGISFGEVNLFCHLFCYAHGAFPDAKSGGLAKFYERMEAVPGIRKVLDGKSKFGELALYMVPLPN